VEALSAMTSDIDIYRPAKFLIDQHGDNAAIQAAQRADEMLGTGDFQHIFYGMLAQLNPSPWHPMPWDCRTPANCAEARISKTESTARELLILPDSVFDQRAWRRGSNTNVGCKSF
jgi:hypothetical protein